MTGVTECPMLFPPAGDRGTRPHADHDGMRRSPSTPVMVATRRS